MNYYNKKHIEITDDISCPTKTHTFLAVTEIMPLLPEKPRKTAYEKMEAKKH